MMKIRRPMAVFSLLMSLAALAISAPSKPHPFIVGVCTHLGQKQTTFAQVNPLLEEAGVTSIRDGISWGRVELEKGKLVFPENLRDLDKTITQLAKRGGQPMIILLYGNKFYGDNDGDGVDSDESIRAFGNYAKFMANHFKGRVKLFEVWNEWNIGMGSPKKPRTVRSIDTYLKVLDVVRDTVKKEIPDATIIAGAVAGPDNRWIQRFIESGGVQKADAFSVHPYFFNQRIKTRPEDAIDWLKELNDKISKANNDKSLPLYLTELGWPNNMAKDPWSPEQTADFLLRFYLQARSLDYVAGTWWYELINAGRRPDDKEHNFGMVEYDSKPKPAFSAMALVSKLTKQTTSIRVSTTDSGMYRADIDMGTRGKCIALWTRNGSVDLHSPEKSILKNIVWGKRAKAESSIEITETPLLSCDNVLN